MASFWTIWNILGRGAHQRLLLLFGLTFISGLVEVVGVGMVIPFMAVASNAAWTGPTSVTHRLTDLLTGCGIPTEQHTVALGLLFVLSIAFANLYQCGFQYYASATVQQQRRYISTYIMKQFSQRPLEWLERENSMDLTKSVLLDVDYTMELINSSIQVAAVMTRCLVVYLFFLMAQASLAIALAVAVAASYRLVFSYIYRPIVEAGGKSYHANLRMGRAASELLGGAREIRASQSEAFFLGRFELAAEDAVQAMIIRGLPGYLTRAALETATVAMVVTLLLWVKIKDGGLSEGLPLLSGYAVAGIRLLPALQTALVQVLKVKFYQPSLQAVARLVENNVAQIQSGSGLPGINFTESIVLQDICYSYTPEQTILDSIGLTIPKNSRVALVGETGAGKSTLVDILLGLRQPQRGKMEVDGVAIGGDNARAWTKQIGYVPQSIFFLDASIAENVAFGHSLEEIDWTRLRQACRGAHIEDFVESLAEGYGTPVGERGVRLSGGQCQRLGIARALYLGTEIILFDEATSSLDTATENLILQELSLLQGHKTMIFAAHRLATVWDFDIIFVIAKGRLVGQGTAPELLKCCPAFARLAEHQMNLQEGSDLPDPQPIPHRGKDIGTMFTVPALGQKVQQPHGDVASESLIV